MKFDIYKILKELALERPVFHNEADFQFALAWEIKKEYDYEVRLEYYIGERVNTKTNQKVRQYTDIIVFGPDDSYIPIELKYKTINSRNTIKVKNEIYNLKNQSARDLGAYAFVSDLKRVENLSLETPEELDGKKFQTGYCIFLTNDKGYITGFKKESMFYNFTLNRCNEKFNGKIFGAIGFDKEVKGTAAESKEIIEFEKSYPVVWEKASRESLGYSEYLYQLVVEVK